MVQNTCAEVTEDTQIRKLSGTRLMIPLIHILDRDNDWEKLMSEIRLSSFDLQTDEYKYSADNIKTISAAGNREHSCAEIFFEEWGTSASDKKLPTVGLLFLYLEKVQLYRAADYVAKNFLKLPEKEYTLSDIHLNVDVEDIALDLNLTAESNNPQRSTVRCSDSNKFTIEVHGDQLNEMSDTLTDLTIVSRKFKLISESLIDSLDEHISKIPFNKLKSATNNFNKNSKLGEGGFGTVYFAKLDTVEQAIKVFKEDAYVQFEQELLIVTYGLNHSKLLFPTAVSLDQVPCLIYPFMPHGSLEDRLALKIENEPPLTWRKRVHIAYDIVEGLDHLHNKPKPIIHRDIKTSNILLDVNDTAKIGDFGLNRKKTKTATSSVGTIQGTDAYMAPEALRGKSSPKMDVYSYGMVLLELLTGLSIIDKDRDHLFEYVQAKVENDYEDIKTLLDEKAGQWDTNIANHMYQNAKDCLEHRMNDRPSSTQMKVRFESLIKKMDTM